MQYSAEYHRLALQASRDRRRVVGKCMQCQEPAIPGLRVCMAHQEANKSRRAKMAARRYREPDRRATVMVDSARARAKRDGVQCTITREWVLTKIESGTCEVTGLPFDLAKHAKHKTNPFAPSIDRINAGGDYSPDNCRVVLLVVNAALNEWGEDVFKMVAAAYLARN